MRTLGEQWIEELDGKMHMVKAVKPVELCQGCCFNCNQGGCCWKGFDDCQMGSFFIIKDLGLVSSDGFLPCPFCGKYPEKAMWHNESKQMYGAKVWCEECGIVFTVETPYYDEWWCLNEVGKRWNRRA